MNYLSLCGAVAAVAGAAACGGSVSLGRFPGDGDGGTQQTADGGPGTTTGSSESPGTSAGADAATTSRGGTSGASVGAGTDAAVEAGACPSSTDFQYSGPRLIAPLSTSRVTNPQPELLFYPDSTDVTVEVCSDRACTKPVLTEPLSPVAQPALLTSIRPNNPLPSGVLYWRVGEGACAWSATWEFTVGAASAPVISSWGTTLDVNGDGYADVAVGDDDPAGPGYVFAYQGSANGLATTPATTLTVAAASPHPNVVASAGDVNGDGFADLLIGVPSTNTTPGQVYVYAGSASGLGTQALATLHEPGTPSATSFAGLVASAGDTNRDGYADVVVTAPTAGSGTVYLYLGGPSGVPDTPVALTGSGEGSVFGGSFAAADVNGDGYGDLIIGSAGADSDTGSVYVYLGGENGLSTTPATTLTGSVPSGVLGVNLASGDVNGDGYADLLVTGGVTEDGYSGYVYIYLGGASGLATTPNLTLGPYTPPLGVNAMKLAIAGDVNKDGYADFLIGNATTMTGDSVLCLGSPMLLTQGGQHAPQCFPLTGIVGHSAGSLVQVSGAGDVNGDGYSDLILGDGSADRAYVFLGGAETTGFTTLATTLFDPHGLPSTEGFGSYVAGATD